MVLFRQAVRLLKTRGIVLPVSPKLLYGMYFNFTIIIS